MAPPTRTQPSRNAPSQPVRAHAHAHAPIPGPSSSVLLPNGGEATAAAASLTASTRHTDALSEFQIRRLRRRLDDLERTNPTDIPASSFIPTTTHQADRSLPSPSPIGTPIAAGPSTATSLQLQQQQQQPPSGKKKQSANVRRILYARKSLKDWLDELPPSPLPPYLSALAPHPRTPPRKICSSCGFIGAYKCPRCAEWSCDRACLEVHERDGGCGVGG